MSQALTLFNKAQMPSHLRDAFAGESNIRERQTVPTLSYEGKVWQVVMNGERTKIMRRNAEGDEEPTAIMRVVVLGVAERRGRAYYEGAYDPSKPGVPLCWSDDGVAPHAQVQEPRSSKCDTCPLSAKGSKVTEQGKAVTACSQHLMLAVVPHNAPESTPLRLKLAITSVWDKQSPDLEKQGWFAFDNYRDFLRANGVSHTAAVVTKMRFDPNVAFPKVMFSPDRWLEDHEVETVKPRLKAPEVVSLLAGTWTPAGADGVPVEAEAKPVMPAKPASVRQTLDEDDDEPAPPKAVKPKAAPVIEMDDDEEPAPPPKAAKPRKAAKPVVIEDDEDDAKVIAMPTKGAKVSNDLPSDLDDIVKGWDDE